MPFEVPTKQFDAIEHAKNKAMRANQFEELIIQQFRASYEDFWGVSGGDKTETVDDKQITKFVGGGSRYSLEEMQSIIDALGPATGQIMTAANGLRVFIDSAYPGSLPNRYKSAAFDYKVDGGRIVLMQLASAWKAPEPEKASEDKQEKAKV